ncbi:MAG TPA: hypothetical protein VFR10_14300 [bacterium]|nr:hypothetical protein [bacterium]
MASQHWKRPAVIGSAWRIEDGSGRRLWSFDSKQTAADLDDIYWDGRTQSGELAVPGVYWIRIATGLEDLKGQFTILR